MTRLIIVLTIKDLTDLIKFREFYKSHVDKPIIFRLNILNEKIKDKERILYEMIFDKKGNFHNCHKNLDYFPEDDPRSEIRHKTIHERCFADIKEDERKNYIVTDCRSDGFQTTMQALTFKQTIEMGAAAVIIDGDKIIEKQERHSNGFENNFIIDAFLKEIKSQLTTKG